MGTIIKPDREVDFYVDWSDIVDAPLAFGPREWMVAHLGAVRDRRPSDPAAVRLDRADATGTSALWPSPADPAYGWNDYGWIYQQQGVLPRTKMIEACERLTKDEHADIRDLLDPFEDG